MIVIQIGAATIARAASFDLLLMWARFLALPDSRAAGLVVHLGLSCAIAAVYALAFGLAGVSDAGWAWGLTAAGIHWLVAGLFLGAVPDAERDGPSGPGPFGMRVGAGFPVGFLIAHLVFGVVVGVVYVALHPGGGLEAAL